jgi:hypothetical protein
MSRTVFQPQEQKSVATWANLRRYVGTMAASNRRCQIPAAAQGEIHFTFAILRRKLRYFAVEITIFIDRRENASPGDLSGRRLAQDDLETYCIAYSRHIWQGPTKKPS